MGPKDKYIRVKWDLKLSIFKKFGSQVIAARALGIRESRLSYLLQGHLQPSKSEREVLGKALGRELVNRAFQLNGQNTNLEEND